jgi:hypothetical protein
MSTTNGDFISSYHLSPFLRGTVVSDNTWNLDSETATPILMGAGATPEASEKPTPAHTRPGLYGLCTPRPQIQEFPPPGCHFLEGAWHLPPMGLLETEVRADA